MPKRPIYATPTVLERVAHATLATAAAVALLVVVVAGFTTRLPDGIAGSVVASHVLCGREATPVDVCGAAGLAVGRGTVVAAR